MTIVDVLITKLLNCEDWKSTRRNLLHSEKDLDECVVCVAEVGRVFFVSVGDKRMKLGICRLLTCALALEDASFRF